MTDRSVEGLVARIRLVASEHGYAVGVHGSRERDLDLIAAPWVPETSAPDLLAAAVAAALGSRARQRSELVHGRVRYVIDVPGGDRPGYVDLSVMSPRSTESSRAGRRARAE